MMRTVVWTETAEKSYKDNLEYLSEYWSKKEIRTFMDKVDEAISNIMIYPFMGSISNDHIQYRKYLIVPQIYLYYRITPEKIYLVAFWNNFQNPDHLKELLT
ncbi:type II toxin-antitoxin system RelE/ParE family toxin [uncultured Chryseobacterium sp.]|uniref:type II toxin-antitoxin system RelE/ParE family toxin n=1 Tax=uncultured Chryseobacterium sp. TaxID=259322 RepID=UPI0026006967|nr:type II toxin-antitoxin system RelE/ParE family toxin [uncultured Chryseobacterium sp.]